MSVLKENDQLIAQMRDGPWTKQGWWYIVFLCLLFVVTRLVYPPTLYHNRLPFHLEVDIIIGLEEGPIHHFVNGGEASICAWRGVRYHLSKNPITTSFSSVDIHHHLGGTYCSVRVMYGAIDGRLERGWGVKCIDISGCMRSNQ